MYHIDTAYTMRGKPYARGDMHRKFSKALGNQCQCDGNCRCGYVKHHRLHCGNCGWNTPYSYNALTDKFTCPSCKTETCINLKKSDIDMSNYIDPSGESPYLDPSGESPFSQGVVGLGIGNEGFLLWSNDPLGESNYSLFSSGDDKKAKGKPKPTPTRPLDESGFDQNTVAYAIGEQGMSLQPFSTPITSGDANIESAFDQNTVAYAIGEQGMSLQPFSTPITSGDRNIESSYELESNLFGNKRKNRDSSGALGLFGAITPIGWVARDSFCGKYCKSLGYMRSADKNAFKKCKASCKVNYGKARVGKWTYPAAPEGVDEYVDPTVLAAAEEKKAESLPKEQVDAMVKSSADSSELAAMKAQLEAMKSEQGSGNKTMNWIVIGVIVVALVGVSIYLINRKKSA